MFVRYWEGNEEELYLTVFFSALEFFDFGEVEDRYEIVKHNTVSCRFWGVVFIYFYHIFLKR